jgi:PKD repeat protein
VPNLVVAPVSAGGKVSLLNGSDGTVQLIADVSGYYRAEDGIPAPTASFTSAKSALTVALTDTSAGVPTSWAWTFGDGKTSTERSPSVTYATSGTYTVTLIASNAGGASAQVAQTITVSDGSLPSISGTVTDAAGPTHHGLAGVIVHVSSYSASDIPTVTTNADGKYAVFGVPAGTDYTVCFLAGDATGGGLDGPGYVTRCYSDPPNSGTETQVTVNSGVTATGIDAALLRGGAFSGKVTDAAHNGLAGVEVTVSSSLGWDVGRSMTKAGGGYTVRGLPSGTDYKVCFSASEATGGALDGPGYLDGCYVNALTSNTVTVVTGAVTSGINAALAGGGAISGTVTESTGTVHHGLGNVWVNVRSGSTSTSGGTYTDVHGSYAVRGLQYGTDYEVCFWADGATGGSADDLGYVYECKTAVTVNVGLEKDTDAALAVKTAISGTVTGGTQQKLAGVEVSVSQEAGSGPSSEWTVTTDSEGTYTLTDLPVGTYQVCFRPSGATGGSLPTLGYAPECWKDQPSGTPTLLTLTTGLHITGINAALGLGGGISGTVKEAASPQKVLVGVKVSVSSNSYTYPSVLTDANGKYTVPGLAAGTDYSACFSGHGATGGSSDAFGYLEQCSDGQQAPLTVYEGQNTLGSNAALTVGGAIRGRVTDEAGTGLANVNVMVRSSFDWWGATSTTTDGNGNYAATGLSTQTDYEVCFDPGQATGGSSEAAGYIDECYDNGSWGSGTPVSVTAGVVGPPINAALIGRTAIAGTVTDAGGAPLSNVQVTVTYGSGSESQSASTDESGKYVLPWLGAGSHTVCFSGSYISGGSSEATGYVGECYNNQPAGTPTPVVVIAGATTIINAALAGKP